MLMQLLIPILVPAALGALAIYWLLPRPRPYPAIRGAIAAGLAIVATGWFLLRADWFTAETLLFYAFSAIALVSGGLLVTQSNPGRAALSFALVVLSTCGLFLLQAAPFLMAATIIIYAGAIIVTFLFVIMLAQQEGRSDADQRSREPLLATIGCFVLLGAVLYMIRSSYDTTEIDRFAERIDQATGRLEAFDERSSQGGSRTDPAEARAALDEISSLVGNERETPAERVARYEKWLNPILAGPLTERDISDGTPDSTFKQFDDAVINVYGPVARGRAQLESGQDLKLDELLEQMRVLNERAQQLRAEARHLSSFLQPRLGPRNAGAAADAKGLLLSEFSGTAADRPVYQMRRDEHGTPRMPAENVAGLGQSLFTDYLLGVELAGTLLLVATIGAIVIAMRRPREGS